MATSENFFYRKIPFIAVIRTVGQLDEKRELIAMPTPAHIAFVLFHADNPSSLSTTGSATGLGPARSSCNVCRKALEKPDEPEDE